MLRHLRALLQRRAWMEPGVSECISLGILKDADLQDGVRDPEFYTAGCDTAWRLHPTKYFDGGMKT